MKIAVGQTRRVFIFKYIVIKVARIYLWRISRSKIRSVYSYFKLISEIGIKEYFRRKRVVKAWREANEDDCEKHRLEVEELRQMNNPRPRFYEMDGTMAIIY